jgi:3-oxoacyl-[acyl-carrier-protein] synthase-3
MSPPAQSKFKNPRAKFNFQGRTCSITGVGSYVPTRALTNAELEKIVETSDEWITTRTGIKERRIAAKDEHTSDLAARAAMRAIQKAGISPGEIDLIIVATITSDMPFPSTACLVQQKIGANRAAAFDLEAACSGFIYALEIAQQFIMSRTYDTVLVIGAEKLSSIVDWKDRNTCVLFGDGAGAMLLEPSEEEDGFIGFLNEIDGSGGDYLKMPAGGSRMPASVNTVNNHLHYVKQDGQRSSSMPSAKCTISVQNCFRVTT